MGRAAPNNILAKDVLMIRSVCLTTVKLTVPYWPRCGTSSRLASLVTMAVRVVVSTITWGMLVIGRTAGAVQIAFSGRTLIVLSRKFITGRWGHWVIGRRLDWGGRVADVVSGR
jgi:hypothetical protein